MEGWHVYRLLVDVFQSKQIGQLGKTHMVFLVVGPLSHWCREGKPPDHKAKKHWHRPLSHWCREGKTLVVRPLKKKLYLCVSSLNDARQ